MRSSANSLTSGLLHAQLKIPIVPQAKLTAQWAHSHYLMFHTRLRASRQRKWRRCSRRRNSARVGRCSSWLVGVDYFAPRQNFLFVCVPGGKLWPPKGGRPLVGAAFIRNTMLGSSVSGPNDAPKNSGWARSEQNVHQAAATQCKHPTRESAAGGRDGGERAAGG